MSQERPGEIQGQNHSLQPICITSPREAPRLSCPQGGTRPHCTVPTGTSMNVALGFSLERCSHSCLHTAQLLPPCVLTGSQGPELGVLHPTPALQKWTLRSAAPLGSPHSAVSSSFVPVKVSEPLQSAQAMRIQGQGLALPCPGRRRASWEEKGFLGGNPWVVRPQLSYLSRASLLAP